MDKDKFTLKRLFEIFFDRDKDGRIDLFKAFPALKEAFANRRLHAALRTTGDIVFTFIIISGLFGPQSAHSNIAIFLSWGLWWPSMVLSWFWVGRMWCGFCPFPGIGRVLQRLGLSFNLPVPQFIQKYSIYLAVGLFALIIWFEEGTDLKHSPMGTVILILTILGGATVCAILFPLQSWCRYLCPMGRMTGVASTLAIVEFRPDHAVCKGCTSFACKKGRANERGCPVFLGAFAVRNNLDCLVCGRCVGLCDKNSPQLNLRSPFTELVLNKGRFITCSYIIPFLMGSQLARLALHGIFLTSCDLSQFCQMALFSLLLAVCFGIMMLVIRVGAWLFGVTYDELFGRFSPMVPVLVPMVFAGELLIRLNYTATQLPEVLPTLGRQFGIPSLLSATFTIPFWMLPAMDIALLISGVLASGYVLKRLVKEEFSELISPDRHYACNILLMLTGLVYLVLMPTLWW